MGVASTARLLMSRRMWSARLNLTPRMQSNRRTVTRGVWSNTCSHCRFPLIPSSISWVTRAGISRCAENVLQGKHNSPHSPPDTPLFHRQLLPTNPPCRPRISESRGVLTQPITIVTKEHVPR